MADRATSVRGWFSPAISPGSRIDAIRSGYTLAATGPASPRSAGEWRAGSAFHDLWMADDTPRMILVQLDGAGPLGHCWMGISEAEMMQQMDRYMSAAGGSR